ncbi:hypothetical protein E2542_SST21479 [Spatholobus suberectus]|nr:hypothetical protein E2542_SST21479 [Spatholobus suberectus]
MVSSIRFPFLFKSSLSVPNNLFFETPRDQRAALFFCVWGPSRADHCDLEHILGLHASTQAYCDSTETRVKIQEEVKFGGSKN